MDINELSDFYEKIKSAMLHSKEYQENINQLKSDVRNEIRPVVVQEKLDKIKELEDIANDLDEMTKNDVNVFNNEISQTLSNNSQKLADYHNKLREETENYEKNRKIIIEKQTRLLLNKQKSSDETILSASKNALDNLSAQHEQQMQSIKDAIQEISDENKSINDFAKKMSLPFPLLKQNIIDEQQQGDNEQQQGDNAQQQGDNAQQQGDNAQQQGDSVKHQGANAQQQGDSVKHQGANAQQQGDSVKHQGANAQQQGDSVKHQGANAQQQGANAQQQGDNANVNKNGIKIKNGALYMSIGKLNKKIDLDKIDQVLDDETRSVSKIARDQYLTCLKGSDREKYSEIKYLIAEMKRHKDKMINNRDFSKENLDPNICKAFELYFLDSIRNGIQNDLPLLENIKNIRNIDKYFDKYMNSVKTNKKDDEFPIQYDVRSGGKLDREDFLNLKECAKNARGFADVKASRLTRFSWNLRGIVNSLFKKMKLPKYTPLLSTVPRNSVDPEKFKKQLKVQQSVNTRNDNKAKENDEHNRVSVNDNKTKDNNEHNRVSVNDNKTKDNDEKDREDR